MLYKQWAGELALLSGFGRMFHSWKRLEAGLKLGATLGSEYRANCSGQTTGRSQRLAGGSPSGLRKSYIALQPQNVFMVKLCQIEPFPNDHVGLLGKQKSPRCCPTTFCMHGVPGVPSLPNLMNPCHKSCQAIDRVTCGTEAKRPSLRGQRATGMKPSLRSW